MSFELASVYKENPGLQKTNESYSCQEGSKPRNEEILSPTCSLEGDFPLSLIRTHHQYPWLQNISEMSSRNDWLQGKFTPEGQRHEGQQWALRAGAFGPGEQVAPGALGRLWSLRVQSTAALV